MKSNPLFTMFLLLLLLACGISPSAITPVDTPTTEMPKSPTATSTPANGYFASIVNSQI